MARYRCEICGAEFGTPSEYRRHMQTSHPQRAPSAADLERALSGIDYPASRKSLVRYAQGNNANEIANILRKLPDRDYRDAADVARAFGGLRAHEDKPTDQPSLRGGKAAMESDEISAARLASLFSGMDFPASADDLRCHAQEQASEDEIDLIYRLPDRCYSDMSDVAKAFGEVKSAKRA